MGGGACAREERKKARSRNNQCSRGGSVKKHLLLALIAVPRVGKMREIHKKGLFFVFFFFFALFVTPSSCSDSDSVTTHRYSQLNENVRVGQ